MTASRLRHQVSFCLTEAEIARLDAMARAANTTRGALARSLIAAILEDDERAEKAAAQEEAA